ncbi:MAG TPA: hypothetical protein VMT86_05635, partial [Bryobacteraceae bacterium]|nr:hypothetical protein [Bryobacteraceae bacterium]
FSGAEKWLSHLSPVQHVFLGGLAIIGLLLSAKIVENLDQATIRLIAGEWGTWAGALRRFLTGRQEDKWNRLRTRLQELAAKPEKDLDDAEQRELAAVKLKMHAYSASRKSLAPTALGNILRAAELRSYDKYGLDAAVCWPRLWLLLPDAARTDVGAARTEVDSAARAFLWSVLFCAWTFVHPVALLIGIVAALLMHRHLKDTAETYGTLLESAFDVYRFSLYRSLGWALPENAEKEPARGAELTNYLWRGSHERTLAFQFEDKEGH